MACKKTDIDKIYFSTMRPIGSIYFFAFKKKLPSARAGLHRAVFSPVGGKKVHEKGGCFQSVSFFGQAGSGEIFRLELFCYFRKTISPGFANLGKYFFKKDYQ